MGFWNGLKGRFSRSQGYSAGQFDAASDSNIAPATNNTLKVKPLKTTVAAAPKKPARKPTTKAATPTPKKVAVKKTATKATPAKAPAKPKTTPKVVK